MDSIPDILAMSQRRYEHIPVDQIKVINSRDRDREQFEMNVASIEHRGLLKPIHVNDKFLSQTGLYELICGEGRLLAHRELKKATVWAQVLTCSRKEAYLKSLIENLARTSPRSMEYARELKRLRVEGWSFRRIAKLTCKSETYIRKYITLVDQGEDRLIQGVEQGVFSMKFALQVASSPDAELQNLLMDAFDEGIVTTTNFAQARQLITARSKDRKQRKSDHSYSVQQLQQDISDATKAKTSYVREARTKENRFITLLSQINILWQDAALLQLVREEGLSERPDLSGDFHYDS